MLFNSGSFLAAFAAFAIVYYAVAHRFRWMVLLAASLAFYATLNVAYVPLLVGVTLVAYLGGLAIERANHERARKGWLIAAVAVVVAVLGAVKYVYAPGAIAGVSFYTFSCVSYLADVYMRRLAAERHAGYFGVYVSFFPKLLAGPIERAKPLLAQLREPAIFKEARVTAGLQQFLWGLFKKVVIADRLVALVDPAYSRPSFASPADLVLSTYFFAFQLYCDFSGYSDMACGAARVLGFDLMENFRRPYLAATTAEFWSRRWHVSLTSWFRDYVYIPLGGSRVSRPRWAINVLLVFLLSALWHGVAWTFVVWGLLNGSYVLISMLLQRRTVPNRPPIGAIGSAIRALLTFHLLLVTWVFFRAQSVSDALTILRRITVSLGHIAPLLRTRLMTPDVIVALVLIAVLMTVEWLDEARPMWVRLAARPTAVRWAAYYALAAALLVFDGIPCNDREPAVTSFGRGAQVCDDRCTIPVDRSGHVHGALHRGGTARIPLCPAQSLLCRTLGTAVAIRLCRARRFSRRGLRVSRHEPAARADDRCQDHQPVRRRWGSGGESAALRLLPHETSNGRSRLRRRLIRGPVASVE